MADHCANSSGDGSGCRFGDSRRRDYRVLRSLISNRSAGWRESGAAGAGDGSGSNALTHVIDASFWLFKGYFDLSVKRRRLKAPGDCWGWSTPWLG
ncbi:hypothetical protein ACNKHS_24825 [Shigella flexneri]